MDLFGLISSIVQSVASTAWPVAVVVCAWVFRKEVARLLPRLHVKYKDTEISFRLNEAEKVADEVAETTEGRALPAPGEDERFLQIAGLSPAAAMVNVRRDVEIALREAVARATASGKLLFDPENAFLSGRPEMIPTSRIVSLLLAENLIDRKTASLLREIIAIGNSAAHERDFNLTVDEAVRYRNLAEVAQSALKEVSPTQVS